MICYPTYGASVQGFERDIQDAQAAGIDGFALDIGAYDDPAQAYYNANVAYMYSAAEALGTGFKLFFSIDLMTNTTAIVQAISTYANRANTFHQGTNVVVSTYLDNGIDWQNGVFAPLSQMGISVCFVPDFPSSLPTWDTSYQDATNILETYSNMLSGLFWFGAGELPSQLASCNSNYTAAVHQAGKIFMASATPAYWGCNQPQNGRRYFEFDGGEGTVTQWQSIIASQPDWVDITTWNDFGESTYVSPVGNPALSEPQIATPIRYCHSGYLDLTKRYIAWYKTGVPPVINQDALYYFYRIHSTNLVAATDIPVTEFYGDVSNVVYNTLFLTAPAQLQVVSGTNSATYSLGAGLQQVRTPFAPGVQSFTVNRNGYPVCTLQGPSILSAITNYDYFTASGYVYGLQPPTNLVAQP